MLPYLQEVQNASKKYSVAFRGLNYGEGAQDGEFAETLNLSTDQFPCITQSAARIEAGKYQNPTALHAKGNLLVIDGTDVYYGDNKVGEVTKGKKQTATIGNYIVIFPDKKYYKVPTEDENGVMQDGEFGSMEETYVGSALSFTTSTIEKTKFPFKEGDSVNISGCANVENNKEGLVIKGVADDELTFEDNSFIETTEDGEVTITNPGFTFEISQNIYIYGTKIERYKANFPFEAGDVVKVSFETSKSQYNRDNVVVSYCTADEIVFTSNVFGASESSTGVVAQASTVIITSHDISYKYSGLSFKPSTITKDSRAFSFKEGDAVTITGCSENGNNKTAEIIIREKTEDKLTFDDNAFAVATETGKVTISRTVPDLDFICESNYRLWGTHGNTIYSSKFSDPFNFQVFDNLVSDSYAIEVGSEGEFTGCIPYSSHICFFKENTLHKLYGTKPSNFQITTANIYGVQSGSEKSMQIVNEQLLYKGVGGVYSYTGGVPELISEKFGTKRYSEAVACCDGEKYHISMKQGDTWNMFTYDVLKNIWLREDDTHAVDMTFYDGKVYYLDAKGGLYYIDKTADRSDIEWGATFCTMHETMNERKGYSKFHLRMDMAAGAWLAVDIKTDNDLQWRQVYTTHNEKAKTVSIPIIPTRCDSIDIRLRGKGKCTIKAFIREFTVGSDV